MSERDEFEAWADHRGHSLLKDEEGAYKSLGTYALWQAWQAARATQAVPALTDEAAMRVALRIMANLEDRKGVLDGVDDDTKADIADEIAVAILAAPQPSPEALTECAEIDPEAWKSLKAHAHDWRFSLQDHMYKCACGATRGDYPFGAASFKD